MERGEGRREKGVLTAVLLFLLTFPGIATAQGEPPTKTMGARTKGAASAPITVYELSDFQCPFCRDFTLNTFPEIERDYIKTGKVRWIFVNLPLTELHPNAAAAAEVGLCAAMQEKFWPVHDLLFLHQKVWAPLKEPGSFFISLADSARLAKQPFQACLANATTQPEVRFEAIGSARVASRTPSFYIEGGILSGAYPPEAFRQIFDSIYKARTVR